MPLEGHSKALVQRIYKTIHTHRMFQPGDRVLVGVSGGPDSVALLYGLKAVSPKLGLTLAIGHLNHDLRGHASNRDASFVAALANRLHLAFFSEKRDVRAYRHLHRLSLETAARQVRYAFFNNVIKIHNYNKIALGHHMDDNAELILMNLLRGSGPTGLSGIPPVRDRLIVRPMIDVTRMQIMDYLAQENHDYVIDASNTDQKHLRNRIRIELLPHLTAEYNPRLVHSLNHMARICRSENRWMEQMIKPVFENVVVDCNHQTVVFSIPKVTRLNPAVQRRLIRKAIRHITGDLRKISFEHIEAIREALRTDGRVPKSIDLPHRIRVSRMDQSLVLRRERHSLRHVPPERPSSVRPSFTYSICPPDELTIEEVGLNLAFTFLDIERPFESFDDADPTTYLDAEKLTFPVIVRNQRPSDRFSPLGLGGTQTVRKFLSTREKKCHNRSTCPVMVCENRIVWVVGYGIADAVKISPHTRCALKVRVSLA